VTTTERHSGKREDRTVVIAQGLSWVARWSLRLVLIALGAALLGLLVAQLWVVVLPVLLALLLATVLWPPAAWLRRHGWPPALAAAAMLGGGLLVLGAVIALLARSITGGVADIAANASGGIEQIRQWLAGPPLNLAQGQLDAALEAATARLQQSVSVIASGLLTGVGAVASGLVTGLLALVLAFLFVKDGPRFLPWLRGVVGARAGVHLCEVLTRIWAMLGGFIQTQAAVALIDAVLIGIGLVIVGVPLALTLAVLTFLGGFVPIVGALVAGALAVLVALVSNGFTAAVIVLGIVVVVQQVEGNVLQPMLQSRSLRLHAAVVLLAVTAGASLYGIAGAFLSVPLVAAAAVVLRYLGERVDARTGAPGSPSGEGVGKTSGATETETGC
jgi:predicted PurR-regulated permease PerM